MFLNDTIEKIQYQSKTLGAHTPLNGPAAPPPFLFLERSLHYLKERIAFELCEPKIFKVCEEREMLD